MSAAGKIDGIIAKINLILESNLKLEATVNDLKKKIGELEEENKLLESKYEGIGNELQLMKMAGQIDVSQEEKAEMKQALKHYMKEIDRCLALLNK